MNTGGRCEYPEFLSNSHTCAHEIGRLECMQLSGRAHMLETLLSLLRGGRGEILR